MRAILGLPPGRTGHRLGNFEVCGAVVVIDLKGSLDEHGRARRWLEDNGEVDERMPVMATWQTRETT